MPRDSDVETSVERADPLVGTIFDRRFRIEERLASGGFGRIYRATHVKSGHPVALKVLLPSFAQDLGVVARFRREGDALTALRNPHTITAYELGQAADRTLFITMELLHGESLFEHYKANGPFEWKRMVRIACQVCESLEEAHALGIVHRDLKPTNIHLETKDGDSDFVKVLDFGIAKIIGGSELDASDLTNAGQMVGTLDYMSPEQMVGGTITGQTDIYTLGIVMYEMIAGAPPFPHAMTAAQALASVMQLEPPPLYTRAPVPEELDRIIRRCLERDAARRYFSASELRADLDRLLAGALPDRAAGLDTKPIARHDDEATTFTPPPERLVAASRRAKRPSGEQTTFTPPPQPLLEASRAAGDWSQNEATTAASPSAQLLAASRRAKRPSGEQTMFTPPPEPLLAESRRAKRPSGEATTFTPPPERVLAELRTAPRPRQEPDDAWTDDDEHAPTGRRRRDASDTARQDDHDKVTAVARLADIVERAAMTRGPASGRADASARAPAPGTAPAVPRTLTPQQAGAPAMPPPGAGPATPRTLTPQPGTSQHGAPSRLPDPSVPPIVAAPYSAPAPAVSPYAPPSPSPYSSPPPGDLSFAAPPAQGAPYPSPGASPYGSPPHQAAPGAAPYPPPPYSPSPYPVLPGAGAGPQREAPNFDMGKMAAREAMIRRLVWIVVLVVAVGVGVVLATQLS